MSWRDKKIYVMWMRNACVRASVSACCVEVRDSKEQSSTKIRCHDSGAHVFGSPAHEQARHTSAEDYCVEAAVVYLCSGAHCSGACCRTTFYSCLIPSPFLCLSAGEPKAQALKCTTEEAHGGGGNVNWHKSLLHSMMQSRFCMIVPGDSQSSERLTDSFVSGLCLNILRHPVICRCL